MTKVYDTATDLITFARSSSGTALRRVGYGDDISVPLDQWVMVGDAATTLTYNAGDGSLEVDAATVLDGARVNLPGLEAGKVYIFEANFTLGTSGDFRLTVGPSYTNFVRRQASGTVQIVFTAQDTNVRIDSYTGTGTFTINSVSVREVIFDRATDPLVLFNHPNDIPRIEYDGSDGSLKGLLIEEQRSNLITYSAPSTDGNLSTQRASLVTVAGVSAPDGSTAIKLQEDGTAAASHDMGTGNIMSASTTYTLSVFAKAAERDFVALNIYSGTTSYWTWFDLSAGTKGSVSNSPVATDIQSAGNGWYRCSLTVTTASSGLPNTRIYISPSNGTLSYDGDGTSGIYVYGAQLEEGSFPTSYIPTSGSTVTRSPDIASIPVSAFGYNQDAGTVVVEASKFGNNNYPRTAMLDNSSEANSIGLGAWSDPTTLVGMIVSGGVVQASIGLGANGNPGTSVFKHGLAFAANSANASVDGSIGSEDTSVTLPEVTTLRLGRNESLPQHLNGHIKSIQYYPRRLTDAQLQELTS